MREKEIGGGIILEVCALTGMYSVQFKMLRSELDDGVLSQTTTLVKRLPFNHGECQHTNIVRVARTHTGPTNLEPQIISSSSEKQDNWLKRKTEIKYLRIKYTIEDQFQFQVDHPPPSIDQRQGFISSNQDSGGNSNQSNEKPPIKIKRNKNKKFCLFQKTSINGNGYAKRNTKNIPKNFCKAFGSYLEGLPQTEEWNVAIKDYKKIERRNKRKYNNIMIHRMLSSPQVCLYFKQFLENHAPEWINNSKITDKDIHREAIQIYYKLLDRLAYAEVDPSPSDQ